MAETKLDAAQEEFEKWWKPQTKPGGRFHGCSQNWGAWEAWKAAHHAADERVRRLEAKIAWAAKVLLQHLNDEDYECSLAGLYAELTVEGKAYRLYATSVSGEEILIGGHYQEASWMNEEIRLLTRLGIKTRTEEYEREYANEG
jgi:hypothetical protein